VLKAIEHLLSKGAAEGDWALVHDAARPLLRSQDLKTLIERAQHDPVGGLLAVPVRDTLKVAGADDRIARTLPREHLWHAQTPQMFGLGRLQRALVQALAAGIQVTDEASAMEWAGECPLLVPGHTDNFKITGPEDMGLADQIIRAREASKT
jgi:2-C-methyl-D-erythritol 4-phosphate cytidylyltransferase